MNTIKEVELKKFYICKLCLIVFGALLAVQSGFAKDNLLEHRIEFPAGDGPFPTVVLLHTAGGFYDVTDT